MEHTGASFPEAVRTPRGFGGNDGTRRKSQPPTASRNRAPQGRGIPAHASAGRRPGAVPEAAEGLAGRDPLSQATWPDRRDRRAFRAGLVGHRPPWAVAGLSQLRRSGAGRGRAGDRVGRRTSLRPLPRAGHVPHPQCARQPDRLWRPHHRQGRAQVSEFARDAAVLQGQELYGLWEARQAIRQEGQVIVVEATWTWSAWRSKASPTRWRRWARRRRPTM